MPDATPGDDNTYFFFEDDFFDLEDLLLVDEVVVPLVDVTVEG